MRLVRFDCGCIGTEPNTDNKSAILAACDNNDGGPGTIDRNMAKKAFEPIDDIRWLWVVFNDAHAAGEMRKALRVLFNEVK